MDSNVVSNVVYTLFLMCMCGKGSYVFVLSRHVHRDGTGGLALCEYLRKLSLSVCGVDYTSRCRYGQNVKKW